MAIYISKQSGLWSSASTWLTGMPSSTFSTNAAISAIGDSGDSPQSGALDKIIIRGTGTVVEYDVNGVFGDGTSISFAGNDVSFLNSCAIALSSGTLKVSRTQSTALTANGQIGIHFNGGWFDWGTQSDPVPASISSNIVFGLPTDTVANRNGLRSFNSTVPDQGNQYNKVTICGASKTRNTQLAYYHSTGTTVLSVLNCAGWAVGDRVIVELPNTITNFNINWTTGSGLNTNAFITNIDGNKVTISSGLVSDCLSGVYVGNFSSNVTLRPGRTMVGGANTNSNSFGLIINPNGFGPNNDVSTYEFRNFSLENFVGSTVFNLGLTYARKDVIINNFSSYIDRTITTDGNYIGMFSAGTGYDHTISNFAIYGNEGRQNSLAARNYAVFSVSDGVFYRAGTAFDINGYIKVNIKNIRYTGNSIPFGAQVNGQLANISDSVFRTGGGYINQASYGVVKTNYLNCTFIGNSIANGAGNPTVFNTVGGSEGNTGIYEIRNPVLSTINPIAIGSSAGASAKTLAINAYNVNNNILDNRRSNSFYFLSGNSNARNRGLASYDWVSRKTNVPYFFTETIPSKANISQRFIGYVKYDDIYGNVNLPYVTFTDDNNTSSVTQTFSCSNTPNVWQKFDITVTPIADGNLTMTVYSQTSSSIARIYLDGITFDPIISRSRHYGFEFNDTFPNRIVDSKITLSESQVSAYPPVNNLNNLYDEARYWSVVNPALTSYIDIVVPDGAKLNATSNNIVLDNTYGTNFEYLTATKFLTLKTLSLSSTSNFNTIKTTGNVYLSGFSNLKNMNLEGTLISDPKNLESVQVTNIKYNSDTPYGITYKNCVVDNVQNSGTGLVSITLDNSTVVNSSGNISLLYNPTILNITNLDGGYIAIFDNNGDLKYYQNTNGTISLPNGSTGTWTYKIGRYNYKTIEGSFSVNPLIGTTIDITPVYLFDSFVFETNVSNVSSYTIFDNVQKVYDYFSYFRTTSAGLSGYSSSNLYNYRSTLDVVNNNIVLNPSAPALFNYDGKTFTLSSKKLEAGTIVKAVETTNNIYLSGSATLSALNVTIGGGLYIESIFDLYDTNVYSGTIVYNTNAIANITYTNCIVNKVINDPSTYTIFITRINSTITDATDPEIITTVPISINITVTSDTYVAIYKPNGTRYYYGSGNTTLILGGDAVTGNWTYKVTRYGYIQSSNTFAMDVNLSSVTNISPTLLIDTAITESVVGTVAAYTDLTTTKKIYDYLAYYNTTSIGIDTNISVTRTPGSIAFIAGVTLDATASNMVSFQTTPNAIVTLKSTALSEIVDIYSNGDFTQANGNIISNSVHIRANNIDSEIELVGITNVKFFPSQADRDSNTNVGPSISSGIYRFKYGNTYSGVLFSGTMWVKADVGSILLYSFTLNQFYNILDLGTFGQIQQVLYSQNIINKGVQKASILIPHTIDI